MVEAIILAIILILTIKLVYFSITLNSTKPDDLVGTKVRVCEGFRVLHSNDYWYVVQDILGKEYKVRSKYRFYRNDFVTIIYHKDDDIWIE